MYAETNSYSDSESPRAQDARGFSDEVRENVTSRASWNRLLHMLLFAVVFGVMHMVLALVVVVQFFTALVGGKPMERLLAFGRDLANYYRDVVLFLTFTTNPDSTLLSRQMRPGTLQPWQHIVSLCQFNL